MSKLTYATLEQFLVDLGFQVQTIPESHILFEHPKKDVHIMLRLYKPDEIVASYGLAHVRHTLDTWGILDGDQFDEQIRQRSLAG
jgi:hypothetical protein